MNIRFIILLFPLGLALTSCQTTGDPDLSQGYFDWDYRKSEPEVLAPRREALAQAQYQTSKLQGEAAKLEQRIRRLNSQIHALQNDLDPNQAAKDFSTAELARKQRQLDELLRQKREAETELRILTGN